jgi:hypothetical protein
LPGTSRTSPWTKTGDDRVGASHGRLDRHRVRGRQVGGDDADRLSRQPVWVSDDGGDVVAGGDGLLQEVAADAAGGRDDGELHQPANVLHRRHRGLGPFEHGSPLLQPW